MKKALHDRFENALNNNVGVFFIYFAPLIDLSN